MLYIAVYGPSRPAERKRVGGPEGGMGAPGDASGLEAVLDRAFTILRPMKPLSSVTESTTE